MFFIYMYIYLPERSANKTSKSRDEVVMLAEVQWKGIRHEKYTEGQAMVDSGFSVITSRRLELIMTLRLPCKLLEAQQFP